MAVGAASLDQRAKNTKQQSELGDISCLAVLQARRLETELDTKLASYAKLCSTVDSGWGSKGESGLATEQVSLSGAF